MRNFLSTAFNVAACVVGGGIGMASCAVVTLSALPHGPDAGGALLFGAGGALLFGVGFFNLLTKGNRNDPPPPSSATKPNGPA